MKKTLHLRPISNDDRSFLFDVFVGTRPDITAAVHLPDEQRNELLRTQFTAQHQHYTTYFSQADFGIIQYGKTPIGRLYLNRTPVELHIIDIAILSKYRSQGFGSTLIRAIIEEARLTNRKVRIHVEKSNPAVKFYQRLGFRQIGEKPMHYEMCWEKGFDREVVIDD